MVIHDLDLSTLDKDLAGFKPNLYVKNLRFKLPFDYPIYLPFFLRYRLMQISQTHISLATSFSHLFSSKRNRIELISDWPEENEAEVISGK